MNLPWKFLLHTADYAEAETFADQYKGDTQTENPVSVVEDHWTEKLSPKRFTVIEGTIPGNSTRFETQYTA